jgi:hypothetical protein
MVNIFKTGSSQLTLGNRKTGFSDVVLRAVLVLTLLFVQAVSLNHNHSGDLSDRVDCDICLKIGSSDDALVSTSLLPVVKALFIAYSSETIEPLRSSTFQASARAPPLA